MSERQQFLKEFISLLQDYDPWELVNNECAPNPSDAFAEGYMCAIEFLKQQL